MDSGTSVSISDGLDNSTFGRFRLLVVVLCGTCLIMDSCDVQPISYAAPSTIKELGVTKSSFGPVFGAGLFGMLIGALALSPVAARFGRHPVLIAATLFLAACVAATAQASSVGKLAAGASGTGAGREVQSAFYENCIWLAAQHLQQYAATRQAAAPMPNRISRVPFTTYSSSPMGSRCSSPPPVRGNGTLCANCWARPLYSMTRTSPPTTIACCSGHGRWLTWLRSLPPWTLPLELEANSISFAPIRRPEELVEDPHLLQAKLTM